jgi:hypothetical protein
MIFISSLIARRLRHDRKCQARATSPTGTPPNMKPITTIMIFAWIAILGLSFTILSDFLWPILIAAVVFTMLVIMLVPRRR